MGGRIGMIVPYDEALDREFWMYAPDDVSIHFNRTPHQSGAVSRENAMAASEPKMLSEASRALAQIDPRVVAFGCAACSFVRGVSGERQIRAAIEAGGAHDAVTTSGAMLEAFRALKVTRVALATPYPSKLAAYLSIFVQQAGFTPVSLESLEFEDGIADASRSSVLGLAHLAMRRDAEAVFLSCTNLATIDAIPVLERELGVPVLAAIQVTMWACLRRLGASSPVSDQLLFRN